MIDITGVDLNKFVREVYALSQPAGLGFLHFTPKPLSEAEAQEITDRDGPTSRIAASMDYVKGRGCKMTVFRDSGGRLTIGDNWFDHTPEQLAELLKRVGVAT